MGHLATWRILEQMIADLRKRGKTIPPEIMNDLKSARTMIKIAEASENCSDVYMRIEQYLANVEAVLVHEGEGAFGQAYVSEWLERIRKATNAPDREEEEAPFVAGVPRGDKWIRMTPVEGLTAGKLKIMAKESELACKVQRDGSIVVHGADENVRAFVKKMTIQQGLKTRK